MEEREVRHQDDVFDVGAADLLDSHPDTERRGRSLPRRLIVLVVLGFVAVTIGVNLVRELVPDSAWPTSCGIDGHRDWCAQPSSDMTDPGLAALAQAQCPALSTLSPTDVVPQPLTSIGPPNRRTHALTSGTAENGSEEALLGRRGQVSRVTRQVGGPDDGRVRVSCPGAAKSAPGVQLDAGQARAVVTATTADRRRIDFAKVAKETAGITRGRNRTDVSFGFLTCKTGALDLTRPQVGGTFSCAVEVYSSYGLGAYRVTYRVTDDAPYFARA